MTSRPPAGQPLSPRALLAELRLVPLDCPASDLPLRLLIAISDDRARYEKQILAAWREGHRLGRQAGYAEGFGAGWDECEADYAAGWRDIQKLLAAPDPVLSPASYERHAIREAARRVRLAEAAEHRDQADHERAFVARAYATHPSQRSEVQQATVRACPPPGQPRRNSRDHHLRVVGDA